MYDSTKLFMNKRFIQRERTLDFRVTDKRFLYSMRFYTATIPLRNYKCLHFGVISKKRNLYYLKMLLKYSFLFQLRICMTPAFLFNIVTECMQRQLWESCCLLLSQTLKRFAKMCNNATFLTKPFGQGGGRNGYFS